jgi:hypothetical protein|tara:strand:- start:1208 stop:1792 length:585 start_codon:yes stop_codon:yes gene_type:complete
MKLFARLCILVLIIGLPTFIYCDDYFVFTHTFKNQDEAQQTAAVRGGWVLNTSFYSKLTPNLFSVVRGPFHSKEEAQLTLNILARGGRYKDSYIKNAGNVDLKAGLNAAGIHPALLVSLLGELNILQTQEKGARHPCEPQEAYSRTEIRFYSVKRGWYDEEGLPFKPEKKHVDIGGFWVIKNSGEIDRMRICAE